MCNLITLVHREDATNHDRATIFHKDLGLDLFGIDGNAVTRHRTGGVLGDIHVKKNAAVWGDLRRDFQFQIGVLELGCRRPTVFARLGVRYLDALMIFAGY